MPRHAGIVGFRGYSGGELQRLLQDHPHVRPVLLEHRAEGALPATAETVRAQALSVVFLATPPEVSMELAPAMLAGGAKVIDLSGAFRLPTAAQYTAWYKEPHTHPELLAEAAYGLPEFCRERIRGARLVANPGCYPTAANLAIRPLLEAGVIDRAAGIVCDAKSGVSGAGRKASLQTSFCEVDGNLSAYAVLHHRHVPEVLMSCGLKEREFSFTAQLLPVARGILETIYFRLAQEVSAERLLAIYRERYTAEPFVRIYPAGHLPDLHGVVRTNYCDIGVRVDAATGRAVIVSAIDNLVKGAAGQALQNMHILLGLPETEGLL